MRPYLSRYYSAALSRGGDIHHAPSTDAAASTASALSQMLGMLTARESGVLDWLCAGKTDREIGAILGISTRTVEKHLEHVYVKLGVESRTAAVLRVQGAQVRLRARV